MADDGRDEHMDTSSAPVKGSIPEVMLCYGEGEHFEELKDVLKALSKKGSIKFLDFLVLAKVGSDYVFNNLPNCDVAVCLLPKAFEFAEGYLSSKNDWGLNRSKEAARKLLPIYNEPSSVCKTLPEFLRIKPLFVRDANDQSRAEFEKELLEALEAPERIDKIYPQGLVSLGLAVNYLTPTTVLLSKEMDKKYDEKFEELKLKHDAANNDTELTKFMKTIIAVPADCTFRPNSELFKSAKKAEGTDGYLELTSSDLHGISRNFTLAVYQFRIGNKVYLVRVEFPNIVSTLDKMTVKKGGVKTSSKQMDETQRNVQREDFIIAVKQLLDVGHKDKYFTVDDFTANDLEEKIKEILESKEAMMPSTIKTHSAVFLDDARNTEEMKEVIQILENHQGIKLLPYRKDPLASTEMDVPGKSVDYMTATAIFWITNGELTDSQNVAVKSYWDYQNKNRGKNRQLFAVLEDGVPIKESDECFAYFDYFNTLTYYKQGSALHEGLMQDLIHICSTAIPLTYPLADVHHGLAWTTLLNFLQFVMPGKVKMGMKPFYGAKETNPSLRQYCKEIKKQPEFKDAIVFPKVILLTEKQCRDIGGTIKYVSIGFKKETLEPDNSELQKATKHAIVKELEVEERRIHIAEGKKRTDEFARFKVSLSRSKNENNYESSLTMIAVRFADVVEKKGLTVNLSSGEHTFKVSVSVSGKSFSEFDEISELRIDNHLLGEVAAGVERSITTGLYKITYKKEEKQPAKVYIACFEFVRAVLSIGEIRDQKLVPVEKEKMEEQCDQFNILFNKEAKEIPAVRDHCELLTFDGDAEENRHDYVDSTDGTRKNNELRLNKIIAEFIQQRIDSDPEYYARLEDDYVEQPLPTK